jgi:hypothetical protein
MALKIVWNLLIFNKSIFVSLCYMLELVFKMNAASYIHYILINVQFFNESLLTHSAISYKEFRVQLMELKE